MSGVLGFWNEYWEHIGKPSRFQVNRQGRVLLKVWPRRILTWVISRDSSARSSSKPRPNPRMKKRRKKMTPNLLKRRRPRAKTRKSRRTRRKMTKRRTMTQIKNRGWTEETKMACTRTIKITLTLETKSMSRRVVISRCSIASMRSCRIATSFNLLLKLRLQVHIVAPRVHLSSTEHNK